MYLNHLIPVMSAGLFNQIGQGFGYVAVADMCLAQESIVFNSTILSSCSTITTVSSLSHVHDMQPRCLIVITHSESSIIQNRQAAKQLGMTTGHTIAILIIKSERMQHSSYKHEQQLYQRV